MRVAANTSGGRGVCVCPRMHWAARTVQIDQIQMTRVGVGVGRRIMLCDQLVDGYRGRSHACIPCPHQRGGGGGGARLTGEPGGSR